jgi:hypothetical protein
LATAGGAAVSFDQSVTAPKNNGAFTGSLKVAGGELKPIIPTAWVSVSPAFLSFATGDGKDGVDDTKSWTVSFTVPSGTLAGTYRANIRAHPSIAGVGEGSGTEVALQVTPSCTAPSEVTFDKIGTLYTCGTADVTVTGASAIGTNPKTFTYSLDDLSYQESATFAGLSPGSYMMYVKATNDCGSDVGSKTFGIVLTAEKIASVTIDSISPGTALTASNCTDAEVTVTASAQTAADGSAGGTFVYYLDRTPQDSNEFSVPLGTHAIMASATNDCTLDPVYSDEVLVSVKAPTSIAIGAVPNEYITGSCERPPISATLTLTCNGGGPLEGKPLDFEYSLDGGESWILIGSDTTDGTTDGSGVASSAGLSVSLAPGASLIYRAGFAGDDWYISSTSGMSEPIPVHYIFVGFGAPLDPVKTTVVRRGSTVPVKLRLYDCGGTEICTNLGGLDPIIDVFKNKGALPVASPSITDAGSSNNNGLFFRYSGTCGAGGNWIYNLQTNTTYITAGNTYLIEATLNDGTKRSGFISIRP